MEARDFDLLIGQTIIDKYHADSTRPPVFEWVGLEWDLLDDVWPPAYSPGGELFADLIPFSGMSSFLEMGCGTGIMSVLAARAGCPSVVGLDINPAAVRNTLINAERHGVTARVQARVSDLYSAVGSAERFDGIYWNPPFLDAPADRVDSSIWHETMFDPAYAKLRGFLQGALGLLRPGGRVYLWFGEALGDPTLIHDLGDEAGLDVHVLKRLSMSAEPGALADSFLGDLVTALGDAVDPVENGEWHLHLLELRPR
ncbi:MAG: methyltransferase [Pseudonocardia sp.]